MHLLMSMSAAKNKEIPGILLLAGQKTFGRNKSNVPIYKFIPNNTELNPLLVPYKMKTMGFSKVFSNLFVLVIANANDSLGKYGTLTNVIGQVDDLASFYDYQIICKNLNISLSNLTKAIIQQKITPNLFSNLSNKEDWMQKYSIQDKLNNAVVWTIDPHGCADFDDAYSISYDIETSASTLTIYIANVPIILDSFSLWDKLSERVATIYLPASKRPMLPTILSEGLCSLKAGTERVAFAMEFSISKDSDIPTFIRHYNCLVNVRRNFIYEEPDLLLNADYQRLKSIISKPNDGSFDSHDVVAKMMIWMNAQSAQLLIEKTQGILRTVVKTENNNESADLSPMAQQIHHWKCMHGEYVLINAGATYRHSALELDAYAHITSPIRRLVDVINMSLLCFENLEAKSIYSLWSGKMDELNIRMKGIQKVQNTCTLLEKITTSPELLSQTLEGFVFDETMVYIPTLKITSKFTSEKTETDEVVVVVDDNVDDLEKNKKLFKIFLFSDEHNIPKKIRIMQV